MYRMTAEILCASALLMIATQSSYAAEQTARKTGTTGSQARLADGKAKNKKVVKAKEKTMMVAARGGELQNVAMRIPNAEIPSDSARLQRPLAVDSQQDKSWFQMLVAGLGVALISIIRRMGSLQ
jgi:hypothetical protein